MLREIIKRGDQRRRLGSAAVQGMDGDNVSQLPNLIPLRDNVANAVKVGTRSQRNEPTFSYAYVRDYVFLPEPILQISDSLLENVCPPPQVFLAQKNYPAVTQLASLLAASLPQQQVIQLCSDLRPRFSRKSTQKLLRGKLRNRKAQQKKSEKLRLFSECCSTKKHTTFRKADASSLY